MDLLYEHIYLPCWTSFMVLLTSLSTRRKSTLFSISLALSFSRKNVNVNNQLDNH